ncbi:MAG: B12-binding domain-containing radical SAM protein [Betaproteobacteria bacterium RIFCSPLOWO2_02_FULL_64_12]|nr:MAG: B12-binding domain-containing radical SAM protein [Betaproteobacteria bacterium RIFCSPLOWO2_02_FULL_64_12]
MPLIALSTLNARYSHASLGLRCLLANMGELQAETSLFEYTIHDRPADIVEQLLAGNPSIVGLGVYIWNAEQSAKVASLLKAVKPDVALVLGGPEVSHELENQPIVRTADHVITGWGERSFAKLCGRILNGPGPLQKIIPGEQPPLHEIALPYRFYTDEDIAHRLLYVEASRGCPFKCEFCLSSLDKTAWPFELERFLAEMQGLYERGARLFKFVDRTFNLNVKASARILDFFLQRLDGRLFAHFEVIPDHLPDRLKEAIARFPAGALQFEVGIQSFNAQVQALISRRQDNAQAEENLRWLRESSKVHVHADLIAGLPGEDLTSFARGFDRLVALAPQEIQVGILKRLRGTPIARHSADFGMKYNPLPPYDLLCNGLLDFATMQRLARFSRYWEITANSGRFARTMPLVLGDDPFARFMRFSDWLYETTHQTHQIALERLYDLLYRWLALEPASDAQHVHQALASDYAGSGARGAPEFMRAPRKKAND